MNKIITADELVGINNIQLVGDKKVEIDGFKFSKKRLECDPIFSLALLATIDPSPKQRELLEKIELRIMDDDNKLFFPRVEEVKDEN